MFHAICNQQLALIAISLQSFGNFQPWQSRRQHLTQILPEHMRELYPTNLRNMASLLRFRLLNDVLEFDMTPP